MTTKVLVELIETDKRGRVRLFLREIQWNYFQLFWGVVGTPKWKCPAGSGKCGAGERNVGEGWRWQVWKSFPRRRQKVAAKKGSRKSREGTLALKKRRTEAQGWNLSEWVSEGWEEEIRGRKGHSWEGAELGQEREERLWVVSGKWGRTFEMPITTPRSWRRLRIGMIMMKILIRCK